jgi:hypothetical protein
MVLNPSVGRADGAAICLNAARNDSARAGSKAASARERREERGGFFNVEDIDSKLIAMSFFTVYIPYLTAIVRNFYGRGRSVRGFHLCSLNEDYSI